MLKPRPIHVSALTGAGVYEILPFAVRIGQAYRVRVPTPELAEFAGGVVARSVPPRGSRFVTDADRDGAAEVHPLRQSAQEHTQVVRYVQNVLRERYDLWGVGVRIRLKSSL